MPPFRQASFAGGELSPYLWGRHDLAKYGVGLKRCRNFFISQHGAALSRPGTTYVATSPNAGPVRLVGFVFSDTQAFVLEFGASYIRFYQNGGVVTSSGSPYQVSTSYAQADLARLQFAQSGDVITITHPNYAPAELKRLSNTNWTLSNISFAVPSNIIGGSTLYSATVSTSALPATWSSATTYQQGAVVMSGSHAYVSLAGTNTNHAVTDTNWWVQEDSAVGRKWQWAITCLVQDTTGLVHETSALLVDPAALVPLSPDRPATVTTSTGSAALSNPVWGFRIYRGMAGVWGYVGSQTAAGDFVDVGLSPDYTQQPPQGANPFVQASPGNGTTYFRRYYPPQSSTDYPQAVCFYEQRRVFGGMVKRPDWVLGSAVGDYYNFDVQLIGNESSSWQFELAAQELAQVRWLADEQQLLVGTSAGVYSMTGSNGQGLSFDNVNAKRQTSVGCSYMRPLKVQQDVLFSRSLQTGVHALTYDFMRQRFQDRDVSLLAQHLFVGYQVTDWAYARDPWSLVHVVRSDGAMLVLTYLPDQEVEAWGWYDTQGTFEAVASIPEGSEHFTYVEVARQVNGVTVRFIERFASRVLPESTTSLNTYVGLDAAATYSGTAATTISGLSYLQGCTVYALADGAVVGPFTVSSTGTITLSVAASYVTVGLAYTPELQTLDLAVQGAEVHSQRKNVGKVWLDVDVSRGFQAGPDFNHLTEPPSRAVSDSYGPPAPVSGLVYTPVNGTWGLDGDVCIRQPYPLPLTVLGVLRETAFGD